MEFEASNPPAKGVIAEHAIEWDDEKVSRLWDYYARRCSDDIYFSKRFGDRILKAAQLPLNEPLAVLDLGCGPGFIFEHLIRIAPRWEYTGLDFSAGSIDKLEARARGHGRFAGALRATTLPSALPDAKFDAVLLLEVIEHLRDEYLASTLEEATRVLKPGGTLVVSTPNDEDLLACTKFCPECGAVFHEWQHVRKWTRGSLTQAIGRYDFEVRFATALDFGAVGVKGKLIKLARKLVIGRVTDPHLIAVFQKRQRGR